MKIVIFHLIFILLFSTVVNAEINPFLKFIFNSAVETDRRQSYHWYYTSPENPVNYIQIRKEYYNKYNKLVISYRNKKVHESNPFARSGNIEIFDKKVDTAKKVINNIHEIIDNKKIANIIYLTATAYEIYAVLNNNYTYRNKYEIVKRYAPQIWMLSYQIEF